MHRSKLPLTTWFWAAHLMAGSDVVTLSGGNATLVFNGRNDIAFLGGSANPVNATTSAVSPLPSCMPPTF